MFVNRISQDLGICISTLVMSLRMPWKKKEKQKEKKNIIQNFEVVLGKKRIKKRIKIPKEIVTYEINPKLSECSLRYGSHVPESVHMCMLLLIVSLCTNICSKTAIKLL